MRSTDITEQTKRLSTRKKDQAPRGVFRHRSGVWAVRFTCAAGHIHQERVGPLKSDAVRVYHERRARVLDEPGWCPAVERRQERARVLREQVRERARMAFRDYGKQYLVWAEVHHRSYETTRGQVEALIAAFGDRKLDEFTTADAEGFLTGLREGRSPSERPLADATVNRYRDRLSGMFKRALRLGLVPTNPVTGIAKAKEPGGRILYLPPTTPDRPAFEENALRDALALELRPLFTVSVHTGLRWSEQVGLQWRDVDLLARVITVARSKHGRSRQVPMNSVVRSILIDLGARRERPDDPDEMVLAPRYAAADKFFPKAVERAHAALTAAGKDASRLDGYTWHGNRHTFASRLVMAGVDLRTVQELGGWRTLGMVQRYAHLAPAHLHAAVERLVGVRELSEREPSTVGAVELRRNFDGASSPNGGVS